MRKITLALLSLLLVPLTMMAQSVTVSPSTGKLLAAATGGSEVGFENGWSALWRHNQLPLTFTVSDAANLSAGGDIAIPAGNINLYNGNIVIMGGVSSDLYCALALPKGYRFTGYKMVLLNNLNGITVSGMRIDYSSNTTGGSRQYLDKVMYETDSSFGKDDESNNVGSYLARGKYTDNESYTMGGQDADNSSTREYVIERTRMSDDDMGNVLYFRLYHEGTGFFGVSIKSFEVYYTAEAQFSATVVPDEVGQATSFASAPFTTSKTDIGAISRNTKNNQTYYSYNYLNVQDVEAYTALYQENAIQDGVPSDVATDKHIVPVKIGDDYLYAFQNDTYYIETPTEVHGQSGWASPIGYRITGAIFNYLWGTKTDGGTKTATTCTITGQNRNSQTVYLNGDLQFTTTRFEWQIDDLGNICNGKRILSCYGDDDQRNLSYSTDKNSRFNLRRETGGYISYTSGSGTKYYLQYINYISNGYGRSWYYTLTEPLVVKSTNNTYYYASYRATSSTQEGATITYAGFTPGAYKLTIFDKDGETEAQTVEVKSASDAGVYELKNLNNDAVKFKIENLEGDNQALVSVTLVMQPLNPYINNFDVICRNSTKDMELKQSLTADNFMVSGGEFKFYIPTEYQGQEMTFTFDQLYSNDGDETYYDKSGKGLARYSFVTSPYFKEVNGNGNKGLYADAYNPDAVYTGKIYAEEVGNIRFRFNNADELTNESGSTGTKYLQEYPFTVANYLGSDDPDNSSKKGNFEAVKLNATSNNKGTYYLFTADETRYNIAPSYAWQHRSYAFYQLDLVLEAKSFTPKLEWKKVYDATCYNKDGKDAEDSMWGLKVQAMDGDTKVVDTEGYLTVKEINDAIGEAITKNEGPASVDQILYLDGSQMYSVVSSNEMTLEDIQKTFSPNALFYLPASNTSKLDNFAYLTESGSFNAGKDVVITDRKPFYAPYDIQLIGETFAIHERNVTWDKNGKVANATVILPFTLSLDGSGNYTSSGGDCELTLNKMNATDALSYEYMNADVHTSGLATSYFSPITGVSVAEANTPYVVKVNKAPEGSSSFVVKQRGARIVATPAVEDNIFTGDTGTGRITDWEGKTTDYTFTAKGSYSGTKIAKAGNHVFYFASNMFLAIQNLRYDNLYVYPFRAYYDYTATGSANANMMNMNISYDENPQTTGIGLAESDRSVLIDENAPVYDLQGRKVANGLREMKAKNPASGIYVINGVKMIVK